MANLMDSQKWWVAKGIWVPAAVVAWVDTMTNSPVWESAWQVAWLVNNVLELIPASISSLAIPALWAVSAWLLSNQIIKDLWIEKKWLKYSINWAAMLWWLAWSVAWWTVAAPYLLAWSAAYWAWKHGWKYWKEAWKRVVWTAWGLTWWAVKWAWKSAWKWMKWEQKINPQL
jgi:hypothetical protein